MIDRHLADKIFAADKYVSGSPRWRHPANRETKSPIEMIECVLDVSGTAVPTFYRVMLLSGSLNAVTVQLEAQERGKGRVRLYRLETNPTRPHRNELYGEQSIAGLFIDTGQSHEPVYIDNLKSTGEIRAKSDAQARPIYEPLTDYKSILSYSCRRVNIKNCGDIPLPPVQGNLL